ncbi:MAG TPA: hypothetical protein VGR26_17735 [Acidimicrobiales bacterium]|nr:hypothetical protein [Acidimicrobiales bacterium]
MVEGGTVLDPDVVSHLLGRRDRTDQLSGLIARQRDCSPSWPRRVLAVLTWLQR